MRAVVFHSNRYFLGKYSYRQILLAKYEDIDIILYCFLKLEMSFKIK